MTPISVFLCEDTEDLRELIRWHLDETDDLSVVGEAGDAISGIRQIAELEPDVVLLDLSLPGMTGAEAIPMIRVAAPGAAIVILSGLSRTANGDDCIALGASDFIEKREPIERVRLAVRAAAGAGSGAEAAL